MGRKKLQKKPCAGPECEKDAIALGLCGSHWRQQRDGEDLRVIKRWSSWEERFWDKVDKRGPDECWNWTAGLNQGYGSMGSVPSGLSRLAHRLSYFIHHGEVLDPSVDLDHKCRNRICVNPAHLRPGTRQQNMENLGLNPKNKSGYRNVHWSKVASKWVANVKHDGKSYHLGYFTSAEEAGMVAYNKRMELKSWNELDREQSDEG